MKTFRKPSWWLFVLGVPQLILLIAELSVLSLLRSEFKDDETWNAWYALLAYHGISLVGTAAYVAYAMRKKADCSFVLPLLVLASQILFLFLFMDKGSILIPWSVPNWMIDKDEFMLLHYTLVVPSVFFGILQLVSYTIDESKPFNIGKSILLTFGIPAAWYVIYLILMPLTRSFRYSENYEQVRWIEQITTGLSVLAVVVFFFFLIRSLLIISIKNEKLHKLRYVTLIIVSMVLPIIGLFVNDYWNGLSSFNGSHIFGDFSHWFFYVLVITNGVALLLPSSTNPLHQRIGVALRFATLPFTLYFFLVFLPFLPLAIVAIIFIGVGFLILSPLVLFIFHIQRLIQDLGDSLLFPTVASKITVMLPLMLLPVLVTTDYMLDKRDLQEAMRYVYEPDYAQKEIDVNPARIQQVLSVVASTGNRSDFLSGKRYKKPYLSSYYRWLVLDNLTLSAKKINEMERIYLGTESRRFWNNRFPPAFDSTFLQSVKPETKSENGFYSTWLHLEIKNPSNQQQEFQTQLTLPEGVYIRNYYLDITGKREYGMLAERKAAQWLYNNIVSVRRDPGLLTYAAENLVSLNVFPLEAGQVRSTGIELIHTGPMSLTLTGKTNKTVEVSATPLFQKKETEGILFLSAEEKNKLPLVTRKPLYYFLLDNSDSSATHKTTLAATTEAEIKNSGLKPSDYEMRSVDFSMKSLGKESWKKEWLSARTRGGFYAERAIRSILAEHHRNASAYFPVIVLVSDGYAIQTWTGADLSFAYPEFDRAFLLRSESRFIVPINALSNLNAPIQGSIRAVISQQTIPALRCWPDANAPKFFLHESGSSVLYTRDLFSEISPSMNSWELALLQAGNTRYLALHPEQVERNWRALLQQNFSSGILSPYTAYMVVETEAQKKLLMQKQKEVMNASPSLDLDEGSVAMSEPAWWWYAAMVLAMVLWRKRREILELRFRI